MKRCFVVVWLVALVTAGSVSASTFLAMSQAELVKASDAVVKGTVKEVRSFWEETGRVIVTEAVIEVEEALVGRPEAQVVVRTWGGTVDGYTVEAHGFPKFQADQRVLLFLEPANGSWAKVAGYQQGHFRVVMDRSGFELAVPTVDDGAHLLSADGRPAPVAKTVSFETLKSSILEHARRAGRLEH
jgi:hypothetical protein